MWPMRTLIRPWFNLQTLNSARCRYTLLTWMATLNCRARRWRPWRQRAEARTPLPGSSRTWGGWRSSNSRRRWRRRWCRRRRCPSGGHPWWWTFSWRASKPQPRLQIHLFSFSWDIWGCMEPRRYSPFTSSFKLPFLFPKRSVFTLVPTLPETCCNEEIVVYLSLWHNFVKLRVFSFNT